MKLKMMAAAAATMMAWAPAQAAVFMFEGWIDFTDGTEAPHPVGTAFFGRAEIPNALAPNYSISLTGGGSQTEFTFSSLLQLDFGSSSFSTLGDFTLTSVDGSFDDDSNFVDTIVLSILAPDFSASVFQYGPATMVGDTSYPSAVYALLSKSITITVRSGESFSRGPGAVTGPIPEPATWAMMLFGFGTIGAVARSRRPRRSAIEAIAN